MAATVVLRFLRNDGHGLDQRVGLPGAEAIISVAIAVRRGARAFGNGGSCVVHAKILGFKFRRAFGDAERSVARVRYNPGQAAVLAHLPQGLCPHALVVLPEPAAALSLHGHSHGPPASAFLCSWTIGLG